jgi:hypothetical protein
MAGSLRYFNYVTDSGQNTGVLIDESNAKAIATPGGALFPAVFVQAGQIPSKVKKRYVNCQNIADPNIKRRFWVGTVAILALLAAGGTIVSIENGITINWRVLSARGEKSTAPFVGDTGQTDGTAGNT